MIRRFAPLCIGSILLCAQQASNDGLRLATRETPPAVKPVLTYEQRGDIYMARKMYREAVETYSLAPQNSPIIVNKIGIAYHQLTVLPQAKKQYEKAAKLDPKYSEAVNNLGTVYYAQKNYRRAISQYKKALKLAPQSATIHANLAYAHFARKKYKQAFEELQKAQALDPLVFEHKNSHGVLLQERSVEERAKFHFYMAKTYAKAGQTESALLYMRKAIEEGFKERQKFVEDEEFAALRELPLFQELMKLEPRAL